ncbi:MAG: hypothetical protein KTR30_22705 [Saprospiraceae bacterium]|nr:hypothetical protein [Saprospiraceae bacterium]
MRFPAIPLASGVQVQKAYIQFTADEAGTDPADLFIRISQEDNAAPFTLDNHNVSQRSLSTQAVNASILDEFGEADD